MKKCKLSLAEKKCIRKILLLLLIQLLIIFSFVFLMSGSQQIDISDTKQIDITVEDLYITRKAKENQLTVVANSTQYLFTGRATAKDRSVDELYSTISKSDTLSLIYYESGKTNVVVDARTETEVYRSFEEYNRGKDGLPGFVVVLYSIIELLFIGILLVYGWIHLKTMKCIYKKFKSRHSRSN